ncbi:hypothetical protein GII36_04160 [Candidatus Mycosynbacter amalyticus]|jgi:hypothetical protein|uniref:Uncharacterized protein n=1 Tax=Candidatus Mycosynbacter amalyticus TaxID=2665156 RepID=A0A857MKD1_9BACT|nr:hypothetical protein [Candidatus Mycosynbacter amalyticus]QHN43023.1 hypothetical protein GII36_04160 [Candidatus Mycosynbacter amalyticus]
MSRPKGSKNQQAIATPDTVQFTVEERIKFIADLIADRIAEDEADGFPLLKKIQEVDNVSRQQTA